MRNKFKSKDGLIWFTAPILSKKEDNLINEIKIFNPERLKKKFVSFLKTNYSKSKYFKKYNSIIIETFNTGVETNKLDQLNIKIINCIKELLKIETKIFISSEIKTNKKKSEKIVEICKHLKFENYLSSVGARDYLLEDKKYFNNKKIKVFIHNYDHPVYNQLFPPFSNYACIIDLLMNEGENSLRIIRSGRKKNQLLF